MPGPLFLHLCPPTPTPPDEEGPSSRIKTPMRQAQPRESVQGSLLPSPFSARDSEGSGSIHTPLSGLARVLLGRAGKLLTPGHSPSPRPQLPSFLPARHLVLVPSKRMRRGSLPLPVIKASPAQLTAKRPPLDTAAGRRGLSRPPPLCHWRLGRSMRSPGSENQGFTYTLVLYPFPASWEELGPGNMTCSLTASSWPWRKQDGEVKDKATCGD